VTGTVEEDVGSYWMTFGKERILETERSSNISQYLEVAMDYPKTNY